MAGLARATGIGTGGAGLERLKGEKAVVPQDDFRIADVHVSLLSRKNGFSWRARESARIAVGNAHSSHLCLSAVGSCFAEPDIHVSLLSRKNGFSWRARESARIAVGNAHSSHLCLSAVGSCFAEPDIHSLSRAREGCHRRLSLCSLPVLKQSEGSLRS